MIRSIRDPTWPSLSHSLTHSFTLLSFSSMGVFCSAVWGLLQVKHTIRIDKMSGQLTFTVAVTPPMTKEQRYYIYRGCRLVQLCCCCLFLLWLGIHSSSCLAYGSHSEFICSSYNYIILSTTNYTYPCRRAYQMRRVTSMDGMLWLEISPFSLNSLPLYHIASKSIYLSYLARLGRTTTNRCQTKCGHSWLSTIKF